MRYRLASARLPAPPGNAAYVSSVGVVFDSSRTDAFWPECLPSANSSIIFSLNCRDVVGLAAGHEAVVDDHFFVDPVPARVLHVRLDGGPRGQRAPTDDIGSIKTHGPWQITATGFPASKKLRANRVAAGVERSSSGFISPPGIMSAS